jgi:hypothetical protein
MEKVELLPREKTKTLEKQCYYCKKIPKTLQKGVISAKIQKH